MRYFHSPHTAEDGDLFYLLKKSRKREWNPLLTKGIKGKAQFQEAMSAQRITL